MKKIMACLLIFSFSFLIGGNVLAKVVVVKKPLPPKTVVARPLPPAKVVVVKERKLPPNAVIIKRGLKKVVFIRRYYYPKKQAVIMQRNFWYSPWKWIAYVEIKNDVLLKEYPYTFALVVDKLKEGIKCKIVQRTGDWFLVKYDTKQGWLKRDKFKIIKVEQAKLAPGEIAEEKQIEVGADQVEDGDAVVVE